MSLTDKEIAYLSSLHGWCIPTKMQRLNALVEQVIEETPKQQEILVVECGVFAGRSLFPMALAGKKHNRGVFWGFDTWDNVAPLEGTNSPENDKYWSELDMEFVLERFIGSIKFLGLGYLVNFSRLRTDEAYNIFKDGSISILHQDSNHSSEVILKELELWAPKMKIGGYWVTDDNDWESTKEGYAKLPDYGFELLEHHKEPVPNTESTTEYAIYKKVR